MTAADVPAVLDLQEPGAVRGLARVFPQDTYPFPRDEIAQRWLREINTPGVDCFVVLADTRVVGFAAIQDDEFLHFGIALERWGSGIAQTAHDAVLDVMRSRHVQLAWLRVFADNGRARRFYEKLGWTTTGESSRSSFAPYPELLRYERAISQA
jgi:RimJ/RimL family protein N-acetyltransferase